MKTYKEFIKEAMVVKIGGKTSETSKKLDRFMDDYYDSTSEHPFDGRARIHGDSATSELSSAFGEIHMHDIRALRPGGGHEALEQIKSLADKHGVEISGTAKAYGRSAKYPMNSKQLAGYYKKRGFEVGSGDSDGYPIRYKPKAKEQ